MTTARAASRAMTRRRRSSRSITTPVKGSMTSAGIVCSISRVPSAISECVAWSTNQVTPAEFIPLPIMETTFAANISRSPRCCRMLRMCIHFSIFAEYCFLAARAGNCHNRAVLMRHIRTSSKLGTAAVALVLTGTGLTGAARDATKPFLVYHDGVYLLFAPEVTGTHRPARLGPWDLGERLSADQETPRDQRLNLYVVVPGGQYHSASHPEYDHNLVINKYPVDHKPREWDIFWCLQLDPSLPTDLRSEHD